MRRDQARAGYNRPGQGGRPPGASGCDPPWRWSPPHQAAGSTQRPATMLARPLTHQLLVGLVFRGGRLSETRTGEAGMFGSNRAFPQPGAH